MIKKAIVVKLAMMKKTISNYKVAEIEHMSEEVGIDRIMKLIEELIVLTREEANRLDSSKYPVAKKFTMNVIIPQSGYRPISKDRRYEKFRFADHVLKWFQDGKYYAEDAFATEEVVSAGKFMKDWVDWQTCLSKNNNYYVCAEKKPRGDCDDLAHWYATMLHSVGYPVSFAMPYLYAHADTSKRTQPLPNHIVVAVAIPAKPRKIGNKFIDPQYKYEWYVADPTGNHTMFPLMTKEQYEYKISPKDKDGKVIARAKIEIVPAFEIDGIIIAPAPDEKKWKELLNNGKQFLGIWAKEL